MSTIAFILYCIETRREKQKFPLFDMLSMGEQMQEGENFSVKVDEHFKYILGSIKMFTSFSHYLL